MQINITDPQTQTTLFIVLLATLVILTGRKDPHPHETNHSHTDELKGVAMLMVLFAHIGYFLFTDTRFLYPLSIAAGVGVNIFLFLSGFGLTVSANTSNKTIIEFYKKRLKVIYIPMWAVLTLVLVLDFFLLNKTYDLNLVVSSFMGFFPVADIYTSINSPLWYFTLIIFYYLIFPLVYKKKTSYFSILLVLILGYIVTTLKLPVSADVQKLYKLHYLAFPLGMFFAQLKDSKADLKIRHMFKDVLPSRALCLLKYISLFLLLFIFAYTTVHSGVGNKTIIEQSISLFSVVLIFLVFLVKDIQSNFLITLGKYSYEIYLIQWPILYRFDFIYKYTPAYLGTLLYIVFFMGIGYLLNRLVKKITELKKRTTF